MPKQIVGSVHWIKNGRQTSRLVDVQEAFSDVEQAKGQVILAEASGDKRQIRLVRMAFRQFQGMRYRGESKAKPSKPSREKPVRAKSSKKPAGRKAQGKASIAKRKARNK
jgi:hypothetical protein